MLRSLAFLAFLAGCSPPHHAIVEVLDPDSLAAEAVALEFGESEDSAMTRISLDGKTFPLSFAATTESDGSRGIWVHALDDNGDRVGRGYGVVGFFSQKTTPTEIVLTPACETAPEHSKCLTADGVRTGKCLGGACFGAVWSRIYESATSSAPTMVKLDSAQDIVMSGMSDIDPTLSRFARSWVSKMNRQGEVLWQRSWGNPDCFSAAVDIGFDGDDNIYVAGMLDWDTGGDGSFGHVTSWTPDGTQIWELKIRFEPASLSETVSGIAVAADGSFAVTGVANAENPVAIQITDYGDIWVRKYNADLSVAWTVFHDGEAGQSDGAAGIAFTSDGDVLLAGIVTRLESGMDIMLRRMSGIDGSEIWTTYYNGPANGNEAVWRVARDDDDNAYLVGWENEGTLSATNTDMFIHRYDASGGLVWARTYNGPVDGDDNGMGVAIDPSGNVVGVGIESTGPSSQGMWIGKLSADGEWLWHLTEEGGFGRAITTEPNGNIIVVGGALVSTGQDADVWVAEYGP